MMRQLYLKIFTNNSLPLSDVNLAVDHLHQQVELFDNVDCTGNKREIKNDILLSLTFMQNILEQQKSSDSSLKAERVLGNNENFQILFDMLDMKDQLVSYCACQLIKILNRQKYCQQAARDALAMQWSHLVSIICDASSSAVGIVHRIDIFRDLFSQKVKEVSTEYTEQSDTKRFISNLLLEELEKFIFLIFNESSNLRLSPLFPNVIFSMSCLWIKLIKQEINKSHKTRECLLNERILNLSNVLLLKLENGCIPQMCLRKCLDVLLDCLPYSQFLSIEKVHPSIYGLLAWRNFCAFKNDENFNLEMLPEREESDDYSKTPSLNHVHWVRDCIRRKSRNKGFGGYINENHCSRKNDEQENPNDSFDLKIKDPDSLETMILETSSSESGSPGFEMHETGSVETRSSKTISLVMKSYHTDFSIQDVTFEVKEFDLTVSRKLVLLLLKSLSIEAHRSYLSLEDGKILHWLESLENFIHSLHLVSNDRFFELQIVELFNEQDDDLIEALLCILDINVCHEQSQQSQHLKSNVAHDETMRQKNLPFWMFLQLLERGGWDHTFLLDLLTSPETCFLLYFTRFLKYMIRNWSEWVNACQSSEALKASNKSINKYNSIKPSALRKVENIIIKKSANFVHDDCDDRINCMEQKTDVVYDGSTGLNLDMHQQTLQKLIDYSDSESDTNDADDNSITSLKLVDSRTAENHDMMITTSETYEFLDKAMTCLIQLRFSIERLIERKVFPYSISPVLRLLKS